MIEVKASRAEAVATLTAAVRRECLVMNGLHLMVDVVGTLIVLGLALVMHSFLLTLFFALMVNNLLACLLERGARARLILKRCSVVVFLVFIFRLLIDSAVFSLR